MAQNDYGNQGSRQTIIAAVLGAGFLAAAALLSAPRSAPNPYRGCNVSITNHRPVETFGASGASITVNGTATTCPSSTVTILENGSQVATTSTDASGNWSWSTTLPDPSTTIITAQMSTVIPSGATKTTSAYFVAHIDSRNPDLVITSPSVETALWVAMPNYPDGGNANDSVRRGLPGYVADANPATTDTGEMVLGADVYIGAATSGTLSVTDSAGGNVQSFPLSQPDPTHVNIPISVANGWMGTLTLSASSTTGATSKTIGLAACVTPPEIQLSPAHMDAGAGVQNTYSYSYGRLAGDYPAMPGLVVNYQIITGPGPACALGSALLYRGLETDGGHYSPPWNAEYITSTPTPVPDPATLSDAGLLGKPGIIAIANMLGPPIWCGSGPDITVGSGYTAIQSSDPLHNSPTSSLTIDVSDGGTAWCVTVDGGSTGIWMQAIYDGDSSSFDPNHPEATFDPKTLQVIDLMAHKGGAMCETKTGNWAQATDGGFFYNLWGGSESQFVVCTPPAPPAAGGGL